jgi:single-strand DNA-binding protein
MKGMGLARIGQDAQLRETQNGDSVLNLSLAFAYGRKDNDGKRPTQWVEASLWGKRAEALEQYLVRGQLVFVALDEVHIETFQKKDGGEGTKLVGRVADIELAGGAPNRDNDDGGGRNDRQQQSRGNGNNSRGNGSQSRGNGNQGNQSRGNGNGGNRNDRPPPGRGFDDMDDDIPF